LIVWFSVSDLTRVFADAVSVAHWVEAAVNAPLADEREWPRVDAEYCHEPRFWAGALGACASEAADAIVVRMNGRPPERMVRLWERHVQRKRNQPTAAASGLLSAPVDGVDDDECS
jgi:hypothetical protein